MSGPKVVRIITREEMVALGQGLLSRLDVVLAVWERSCAGTGLAQPNEVADARRRREEIAALLTTDRFMDLQKAAPIEMNFLKYDTAYRHGKAAKAAAQARTAARREREAAAALLAALQRKGVEVPPAVDAGLKAASSGNGDAGAAVTAGLRLLAAPGAAQSAALRDLAAKLKGTDDDRAVETWLAAQAPAADEKPLALIELRLAESDGLLAEAEETAFEGRLAAIRDEADGTRCSLLLDSLALDLGKALTMARASKAQGALLAEALADLTNLDPARVEAFAAMAEPASPAELGNRVEAVEAAVAAARQALAAATRRKAVLEGLAGLGYEVGAEMDTAWVKDGHVVLRRAAQPNYGVELTSPASADRLQMRVVAFDAATQDSARDRDAETLWCGDVETLRTSLAAAGTSLEIERALPVGAALVKRLANPGLLEAGRDWVKAPRKGRTRD